MYNDKLVIWVVFLVILWKEKEALSSSPFYNCFF